MTILEVSTPILPPPIVTSRVDAAAPSAWSLHWRGRVYPESALTGQHMATLALIAGSDDYSTLDLDPRQGHQRLMQMLMAFVAVESADSVTDDVDMAAVLARAIDTIAKAPAEEILGALRYD